MEKIVTKDKYIGYIREKRVQAFVEKRYKWEVEHANMAMDKYHSIDLVCRDKDGELIYIQVKGYSWIGKPFSQKAIDVAKLHGARLYYAYVGNKYKSQIRMLKYEEQEE